MTSTNRILQLIFIHFNIGAALRVIVTFKAAFFLFIRIKLLQKQ